MKNVHLEKVVPQTMRHLLVTFATVLFFVAFVSSAIAVELKTSKTSPSEVKGTYQLMLYGCAAPSSTENVAILVKEDSTYDVDIFAPAGSYMVTRSVEGADGLAKAAEFLKCNSDAKQTLLRKIMGPKGTLLGFELVPVYNSGSDFPTHYTFNKKKNRVRAYVKMEIPPDDGE